MHFVDKFRQLLKLYKKPDEKIEEKKKTTILISSELDYSNMNTLMIEANKIVEKGAGAGEIKVPKSIADNLATFFDYDNSFKLDENSDQNVTSTSIATQLELEKKYEAQLQKSI